MKLMKKRVLSLVLMLMLLTALVLPAALADDAVPALSAAADSLAGSWRLPPSPYGDDFTCYLVLNADGTFLNVTNLYLSGGSGAYTQTVTTNETFTWTRTGSNEIELHYSYLDDNGEFVTALSYVSAEDALYFCGELYATRDHSFVPDTVSP